MFRGDYTLTGAPIISNFIILTTFLTFVLLLAQDDTLLIPLLDIIQTFCCWGSFLESILIPAFLWCFRHIERIFGSFSLFLFLFYNLIAYFPFFALTTFLLGFHKHFSFLYFVPYSLLASFTWHLPAVSVSGPITDKLIIFVGFGLLIVLNFPFSLFCLISTHIGNFLWSNDTFKIRKFFNNQQFLSISSANDTELVDFSPLNIEETTTTNQNPDIQQIVDLGFSEEEVRAALQANDNDANRAIDQLLSHS